MSRFRLALLIVVVVCGAALVDRVAAQTNLPLPVTDSELYDQLDAVLRAPGPGGDTFDGGESVNPFTGNLSIQHPSSPGIPVQGGLTISLGRAYNSANVRLTRVRLPSGSYQNRFNGRSWVGVGWTMHLGRIFERSRYNATTQNYEDREQNLEFPSGALMRFFSGVSWAHPNLNFEYIVPCAVQGPSCPDRKFAEEYCEDPNCVPTGEEPFWLVTAPGGTKYRYYERVVTQTADNTDTGWITNSDRNGFYVREIEDPHGNKIHVDYWDGTAYPEAIKAIYWVANPARRIDTTLWTDSDASSGACPQVAIGTLKSLTATGFKGDRASAQTVTYTYHYTTVGLTDDAGSYSLPLLAGVDVLGSNSEGGGGIAYAYGGGVTVKSGELTNAVLLDRIRYPLWAEVEYEYGTWQSGKRSGAGGGRTQVGVIGRYSYPRGKSALPQTQIVSHAPWSWTRTFDVPNCTDDETAATREVAMTGPDGRQTKSFVGGHPCGTATADWGAYGLPEKVQIFEPGTTTAYRTVESGWDYSAGGYGWFEKELRSFQKTTFNDDHGTCFGTSGGTDQPWMKQWTTSRDSLGFWKMSVVQGDYMPWHDGAPTKLIQYAEYQHYSTAGVPACWSIDRVVGAPKYTFTELAGQRTEQSFTYTCDGRVASARSRADVAQATTVLFPLTTTPALDTDPDGDDRTTSTSYDPATGLPDNSTLTGGKNYSDGSASGRSFSTSYQWSLGQLNKVLPAGLTYPSTDVTPDISGAVSSSRDPNNLATQLDYDAFGRPTRVEPSGAEDAVRMIYPDLRSTRIVRSPGTESEFQLGNAAQVYAESTLDDSGRVELTRAHTGDESASGKSLSVQVTKYDQFGRRIFVSARMTDEQLNGATLVNWLSPDRDQNGAADFAVEGIPLTPEGGPWGTIYFYGTPATGADAANPLRATPDPLGRLRRIEGPDGGVIEYEYCGPHVRTTVHGIQSTLGAENEIPSVTTQYFDGLGRLAVVDAPAGSADAEYRYDINGRLTLVNLTDALPANPFKAWLEGQVPPGQQRTFTYNALGQLLSATSPEKGLEEFKAYDAAGNLLEYIDANGREYNYFGKLTYDSAGRLTAAKKVPGTPAAPNPSDPPHYINDWDAVGGTPWVEGRLDYSSNLFSAQDTPWTLISTRSLCIGGSGATGPPDFKSLYFGNPATCSYDIADAGPVAARYEVTAAERFLKIRFSYWRQLRSGTGGLDKFLVFVTPAADGSSIANRRVVFALDDRHASFARWEQSPEIRLSDLFSASEWPTGTTKDLRIYIVFEKGDTGSPGVGAGIAVDNVRVGRFLGDGVSYEYDTDKCGEVPSAACDSGEEPQNRYLGKLTKVTAGSATGGTAAEIVRYIYRGTGGRLSSEVHDVNAGTGGSPRFLARYFYNHLGQVSYFNAPYNPGVDETRVYGYTYRRGLLDGIEQTEGDVLIGPGGTTPSIKYDVNGLPTAIAFASGASTIFGRDRLGRPSEIQAKNSVNTTLWDSGSYLYDSAGNIKGVGSQRYSYDAVGRLTAARVGPQATQDPAGALYEVGYNYDALGNMTSRTWSNPSTANPPLGDTTAPQGFVFDGTTRPYPGSLTANRNQIAGASGYRYDPNGNSIRMSGTTTGNAASYDELNRLTAYFTSDPESATTVARTGPAESYVYGASGFRVARRDHAQDGLPIISIRLANGQVASEYVNKPGNPNWQLRRDYVYGLGQVLVERTPASGNPTAASTAPMSSSGNLTMSVSGVSLPNTLLADVRTGNGFVNAVSGISADSLGNFVIPESALYPGATNYIRVRAQSGEGAAYSPEVSASVDPTVTSQSVNQVRAISVSRVGSDLVLRWALGTSNNKRFRIYFTRGDTGVTFMINAAPLTAGTRSYTINAQTLSVPCGAFSIRQLESNNTETIGSIAAGIPSSSTLQSTIGTPGQPCVPPPPPPPGGYTMVNSFQHRDHLGSLRVATDSRGWLEADGRYDYYPFGRQMVRYGASEVGAGRRRYTGHERDGYVGKDQMFFREKLANDAMFLTPDPLSPRVSTPIAWNRYAYAWNRPTVAVDKYGLEPCFIEDVDIDGDGIPDPHWGECVTGWGDDPGPIGSVGGGSVTCCDFFDPWLAAPDEWMFRGGGRGGGGGGGGGSGPGSPGPGQEKTPCEALAKAARALWNAADLGTNQWTAGVSAFPVPGGGPGGSIQFGAGGDQNGAYFWSLQLGFGYAAGSGASGAVGFSHAGTPSHTDTRWFGGLGGGAVATPKAGVFVESTTGVTVSKGSIDWTGLDVGVAWGGQVVGYAQGTATATFELGNLFDDLESVCNWFYPGG